MSTHREWHQTFEAMMKRLTRAQGERDQRQAFDRDAGVPQWVLHERQVMADVVAEMRGEQVPDEALLRVETHARGHFDYTSKYALGCADLVHADDPSAWPLHRALL